MDYAVGIGSAAESHFLKSYFHQIFGGLNKFRKEFQKYCHLRIVLLTALPNFQRNILFAALRGSNGLEAVDADDNSFRIGLAVDVSGVHTGDSVDNFVVVVISKAVTVQARTDYRYDVFLLIHAHLPIDRE